MQKSRIMGAEEAKVVGCRLWCGDVSAVALCITIFCLAAVEPVLSLEAGVQVGDQARWTVRTDWSSGSPSIASTSITEFVQSIETLEARVCRVDGLILTYDLTARSRNGAARTPRPRVNLSSGVLGGSVSRLSRVGIPALGAHFVVAGLNVGDSFSIWWRGQPRLLVVEGLESGRFAGAVRQVITASHTTSSEDSTEVVSWEWDQSTGILCEATLSLTNSTLSLNTSIQILETNRWGIVKRSSLGITLISVIILVAIVALLSHRWPLHGRKQGAR